MGLDVVQWVVEHWEGVFGVGGITMAVVQTRRINAVADARVKTALADALEGMRTDLVQARDWAKEALAKASACESARDEERKACESLIGGLRGELEKLRSEVLSQHSPRGGA